METVPSLQWVAVVKLLPHQTGSLGHQGILTLQELSLKSSTRMENSLQSDMKELSSHLQIMEPLGLQGLLELLEISMESPTKNNPHVLLRHFPT